MLKVLIQRSTSGEGDFVCEAMAGVRHKAVAGFKRQQAAGWPQASGFGTVIKRASGAPRRVALAPLKSDRASASTSGNLLNYVFCAEFQRQYANHCINQRREVATVQRQTDMR
ncbi:hypothetical protein [Bradyrhizobium sp. BR 1432]|uniref:hypothetical protein n=1 Tax=Bradyrhizobium sp. BR 1432 TaxID=3447966 RepID=UPI003EE44CBB